MTVPTFPDPPPRPSARRSTFLGLFLICLATLMLQILLTRIFSVTMHYHFAFVAISIAMFGMTVGAVIVHLLPRFFGAERAHEALALAALGFAWTAVGSFWIHQGAPPAFLAVGRGFLGFLALVGGYLVVAAPFVTGGIAVCVALTRFPAQVGRLYAADLTGAAFGCLALVVLLSRVDAPTAIAVVACVGALAAVSFSLAAPLRTSLMLSLASLVALAALATGIARSVADAGSLAWLRSAKNYGWSKPLWERWNSFAYVSVSGDPAAEKVPTGWGMSARLPGDLRVHQVKLMIDELAATVLTRFDGDLSHLEYDVTNVAHGVTSNADVLTIGVGGGRDILSALHFGQRSVTGVEINENILFALNREFGDFTGHLDRDPRVSFVNDEARSWVARQNRSFGVIQVSLIDTWAATAAGAFVLTENSLYTVEAWQELLEHLTPDGVLTFSRWYHPSNPYETYRMVNLAVTALEAQGVARPGAHLTLVAYVPPPEGPRPEHGGWGISTILVGRSPLTAPIVARAREIAERMDFRVLASPAGSTDPVLARITSGEDLAAYLRGLPVDISAPTDDKPFFFNMLRPRDLADVRFWNGEWVTPNVIALRLLVTLLGVVLVLSFLFTILPLALGGGWRSTKPQPALALFFSSIGLGFLMIEVSQVQRLAVFLGHPVYGLSVVLFSLLLASGAGSYSTQWISDADLVPRARRRLVILLAALVVFAVFTPIVTQAFRSAETAVRIAVAAGTLALLGFFMGMAFPLGMRLVARSAPELAAWFWTVNGATSVCASVIAVVVSLALSISGAYWVGTACYAVALAAFLRASPALR